MMKALEDLLNAKEKANPLKAEAAPAKSMVKINLDDSEFGKY